MALKAMKIKLDIFLCFSTIVSLINCELVINVRINQQNEKNLDLDENGLSVQNFASGTDESESIGFLSQKINGNSSTDTVTIEYTENDGTVVTQMTDFRMQSQITRILILGEEELNQPKFQALCFVTFYTGDLIPPEAVMKLRQKHPGTIRVAEEDLGDVVQDSPLLLNAQTPAKLATTISSHLSSLCRDAREATFTSQHELYNILSAVANGGKPNLSKANPLLLKTVAKNAVSGYESLPRCFTLLLPELAKNNGGDLNRLQESDEKKGQAIKLKPKQQPCICSKRVWFNWFPCALKYCRNKDGEGEHRCGIKTCRKCMTFRYPVKSKNYCSWDEP